jgi:hypothetical protein
VSVPAASSIEKQGLLPSAGCWAPWPEVPAAPTSSCPCSRTQPAKSIQRRQRSFLNDSSSTPCRHAPCPQSYISVGRIQPPNGSSAPRITWNKGRTQLSHECPKKTHKTGTTTGYVGQSTKTTPRAAVTPNDESVPAEIRTILRSTDRRRACCSPSTTTALNSGLWAGPVAIGRMSPRF